MKILVTGGAGYIGSHTALALMEAGFEVVLLDNFSTSSRIAVEAIRTLANRSVPCVEADILDHGALDATFEEHGFDAVVHFAAFKAVGESVADPLKYYHNNVEGSVAVLDRMHAHGVKTIVFSSSATVYGDPAYVPITEDFPTQPTNPYGRSKLTVENVLTDMQSADPSWSVSILRYFNPAGAHSSGEIGEDPAGPPANLMPYISQVAVGRRSHLNVFGNDYPTRDGTGVRDYIHVTDLARGHVKALEYLANGPRIAIHNLGTGTGYSVLETLRAFEKVCGREIPYRIVDRRPGDIAECYADPSKAEAELGWSAELGLEHMCRDHWHWQSTHPNGFADNA